MIKKYGFTLIELLIVIVIIGILAGVVLAVLNPAKAQRKSMESVMRANFNKMCLSLFSCASTTTLVGSCNTADKIGYIQPTQPATAIYAVPALAGTTVTLTATLNAALGSPTNCVYSCSYNFSDGSSTNTTTTGGTGCLQ